MYKPRFYTSVIGLFLGIDFLLQALSLLPSKFRGGVDSTLFTQMVNSEAAFIFSVPSLLIFLGFSKFGQHHLYKHFINHGWIIILAALAVKAWSIISTIVATPLSDHAVDIISLTFIGFSSYWLATNRNFLFNLKTEF